MKLPQLRWIAPIVALLLAALWLLGLPASPWTGGFWTIRHQLIYLSGILAMGFMALGLVLAARPVQIEPLLGGLDKFYRLHRWFGISGVALAVIHWLLEVSPRWMIGWGWLSRPVRGRPPGPAPTPNVLDTLHGAAVGVGEPALYLLILLIALALWKRVPYHWFFRAHRLMAPLFLVLVFHAVVLMDRDYWSAPIGPVMALLLALGTLAAVAALFRRIGKSRRAVGEIRRLTLYPDNAVLDVAVDVGTAWPGHQAGQFAFLKADDREGAHPFTISSAWKGDGHLVFSIKGLGDYTRKLPELLHVGQSVTVEGPYGRFDFQGRSDRQVWIAGGVGITPFMARLQHLAQEPRESKVDLFYSTAAHDEDFVAQVRDLAASAHVSFHLQVTPKDGLLTLERIAQIVPDWSSADIWFCGPAGFGHALQAALTEAGLPGGRFHQELFEMR